MIEQISVPALNTSETLTLASTAEYTSKQTNEGEHKRASGTRTH